MAVMYTDKDECDKCPNHKWILRNNQQTIQENGYLRSRIRMRDAEICALKLERDMGYWKDQNNVEWLQAKVVKQAKELGRINAAIQAKYLQQVGEVCPEGVDISSWKHTLGTPKPTEESS